MIDPKHIRIGDRVGATFKVLDIIRAKETVVRIETDAGSCDVRCDELTSHEKAPPTIGDRVCLVRSPGERVGLGELLAIREGDGFVDWCKGANNRTFSNLQSRQPMAKLERV